MQMKPEFYVDARAWVNVEVLSKEKMFLADAFPN